VTHKLTFTTLHQYNTREVGITVPVRLSFGERSVDVSTKLDTGASLCIFQRGLGEALGLDIETGHPQEISTPTGSFITYGHELTLSVLNFHFETNCLFRS
jgi:hypothetical protein